MKTIDIDHKILEENVDYELIPGQGENWDVRILSGDFIETVIQFEELKVSDDEEYIRFNFEVVSSPDPELNSNEESLQQHAGQILSSILHNAAEVRAAE